MTFSSKLIQKVFFCMDVSFYISKWNILNQGSYNENDLVNGIVHSYFSGCQTRSKIDSSSVSNIENENGEENIPITITNPPNNLIQQRLLRYLDNFDSYLRSAKNEADVDRRVLLVRRSGIKSELRIFKFYFGFIKKNTLN